MNTVSAIVTGCRKIEFVEEKLPALGEHDVLIKTDAVGLCHTDLPIYLCQQYFGTSKHGYRESQQVVPPVKIGHEPVGTVIEVGSAVTRFAPGDKVSGNYTQAFTTYRIVPDTALLVKLPEMDRDHRFCIAEPMGCVTNILHKVLQYGARSVGLVGCGYMNLMMMSALRDAGIETIVAFDILDSKLSLAKEFGATHTFNSAREDYVEGTYQLTGGKFLDCVIEMCGSLNGLFTACRTVKFSRTNGQLDGEYNGRGYIVITSVYSGLETMSVELANEIVLRAPILDAAHPMSGESMLQNDIEAVEDYARGVIPMDRLVTHTTSFERLAEGFDWMEHPPKGYLKGVVLF